MAEENNFKKDPKEVLLMVKILYPAAKYRIEILRQWCV